MTSRMTGTGNLVVLGCLALGSALVAWAQRPNIQVFQSETGMQVVLESIRATDGRMWVRPKSQVYFRLVPKDASEQLAPLPPHTLMVCREFNYVGSMGESHAAFRCGSSSYALEAFGFNNGGEEGDVPAPVTRHKNLGQPAGGLK